MKKRKMITAVLLTAFFCVLLSGNINRVGKYEEYRGMELSDAWYRKYFGAKEMAEVKEYLAEECLALYRNVLREVEYFPVAESSVDQSFAVSYVDSWNAERNYKGKSGHEGTDIMALQDKRGIYPIVSMTDGTITSLGWLEKGGYRVGITTDSGTYYYYAHLESYANLQEGDTVKAGELLGYMGDSGYGEEGTVGKFPVHLHLGIYTYAAGEELSVNPYYILLSLEEKKLCYEY